MSVLIEASTQVVGVVIFVTVVVNVPHFQTVAEPETESYQSGVDELLETSTGVENDGCAVAVIIAVSQGSKMFSENVAEAVGAEARGTTLQFCRVDVNVMVFVPFLVKSVVNNEKSMVVVVAENVKGAPLLKAGEAVIQNAQLYPHEGTCVVNPAIAKDQVKIVPDSTE